MQKLGLLVSAAGIVTVAGAQAADLPTRKAAPAEYVKICNVDGMAGFVIPGGETCLKVGGFISAHVEVGNTKTGYYWASPAGQGTALKSTAADLHDAFGWTTRAELDIDARQNTAYGVLRGFAGIRYENGNGFDTDVNSVYIDLAYIQWAGVTAGKATSFFSFFGGGEGWANFFSPDQQGQNEGDLLAYTATLGGGFSATISVQSPGSNGFSGPGVNENVNNYTPFGAPATASNTP